MPHTMPLGELYRLTGGCDGIREALGITRCYLSYKDKCAKILREHAEKQAKMEAEWSILVERGRKKNAESSDRYAAKHEALLAAKRSAKRRLMNGVSCFLFRFFIKDCGDSQVITKFPPMPKSIPTVAVETVLSVEDCPDCQGQAKLRALTKNKKNINKTISRH